MPPKKHLNKGIRRANLGNQEQAKKSIADRENRVRTTRFLLTINPNKKYKLNEDGSVPPEYEQYQKDFIQTIDNAISGEHIEEWFTGDLKKKGGIISGETSKYDIKSTETEGQLEVGTKVGRLHAHIIMKVKHTGKLQIDPNKVQDYFQEALGVYTNGKKVYVNVKHIPDAVGNVYSYLGKTIQNEPQLEEETEKKLEKLFKKNKNSTDEEETEHLGQEIYDQLNKLKI